MCLHVILAYLVPSSTPHTSWLHGLVQTFVNSAVNNKFIAINIEMLQVVDRNCWAMEQSKQPRVNCVNLMTCDSSTTTMLPKKQQQCDQLRSSPPKPNEKGKGCSDNQDPQSPVIFGSQSKGKAPGAPTYTPGEQKVIPAPPKKRLLPKRSESKRRPKRQMRHHAL
jgi:hypothetical protein